MKDTLEKFLGVVDFLNKNEEKPIDKDYVKSLTPKGALSNYLGSKVLKPEQKIWYAVEAYTRIEDKSPFGDKIKVEKNAIPPLTKLFNYIKQSNEGLESGKFYFDESDKKELDEVMRDDLQHMPELYQIWRELRIKEYLKDVNKDAALTEVENVFNKYNFDKRKKYILELGNVTKNYLSRKQ